MERNYPHLPSVIAGEAPLRLPAGHGRQPPHLSSTQAAQLLQQSGLAGDLLALIGVEDGIALPGGALLELLHLSQLLLHVAYLLGRIRGRLGAPSAAAAGGAVLGAAAGVQLECRKVFWNPKGARPLLTR
jgi:hypothetical protein